MRFIWTIMLVGLCAKAHAAPELDQSNIVPTRGTFGYTFHEIGTGSDWAQTFTVAKAGQLSSVEVQAYRLRNSRAALLIDVRGTTRSGAPVEANTDVLASASIAPAGLPFRDGATFPDSPVFIPIDLSAFGIRVEPGDVLAIVLRTTEPSDYGTGRGYSWQGANYGADAYGGGDSYGRVFNPTFTPFSGRASTDAGFRTFVTVREPAGLALAACAGAALLRRRPHGVRRT